MKSAWRNSVMAPHNHLYLGQHIIQVSLHVTLIAACQGIEAYGGQCFTVYATLLLINGHGDQFRDNTWLHALTSPVVAAHIGKKQAELANIQEITLQLEMEVTEPAK
jgi:hypothetical protein